MIKWDPLSINLGSVEYVYTPEEMQKSSQVMPKSWCFVEDLKIATSETLAKALEERQKFKEQNNPFKDLNSDLRKTHRPDLWY